MNAETLTINGLLRRAITLIVADRIDTFGAMTAQDDLHNYLVRCGVSMPDPDALLEAAHDDEDAAMRDLETWLDANLPEPQA